MFSQIDHLLLLLESLRTFVALFLKAIVRINKLGVLLTIFHENHHFLMLFRQKFHEIETFWAIKALVGFSFDEQKILPQTTVL